VDYFYSAAEHYSCGALWVIFDLALILLKVLEARAGIEPKSASKTKDLFDSKKDRVKEMQRITDL
jgi:hypothetical protein